MITRRGSLMNVHARAVVTAVRPPAARRLPWRLIPRGDTLPGDLWERRHRFLVGLLAIHAALLPIAGVLGGYRIVHAVAEGALAPLAFALAAIVLGRRGRKLGSAFAAVGLLTCSGLVIHFSGGYIEAHFHFFAMMVILGLYEDWLPFGLAFAYVFLHHGVFGTLSPESVYNHPDALADPWRWAGIHAAAISVAGILGIAAWRLNEELRATLRLREAQLAASHAELAAAYDELKGLDQMKTDFIATASHELRTPLTSVVGFTRTLLERWESLDEPARRGFVGVVNEQGERLERLVSELLDLSRIDAGELAVNPERVELRPLIERVAGGGGGDLDVSVPDGIAAYADRGHLEQMIANYLTNAAYYGRPPVRVEAEWKDGMVEIAVHDHGAGVPADFVPRLFERFSRPSSAERSGTGLGLAIVRGLAEANGGSVWYRHNGTTAFGLRLPAGGAG
jgi:signal transduction histidine kinase